jgi:hypothetical protein
MVEGEAAELRLFGGTRNQNRQVGKQLGSQFSESPTRSRVRIASGMYWRSLRIGLQWELNMKLMGPVRPAA